MGSSGRSWPGTCLDPVLVGCGGVGVRHVEEQLLVVVEGEVLDHVLGPGVARRVELVLAAVLGHQLVGGVDIQVLVRIEQV